MKGCYCVLRHFCVIAVIYGTVGHVAHADEQFETAAQKLLPARQYHVGRSSLSVNLSCDRNRLQSDDLVTLEVSIECLSGGAFEKLSNPFLEPDLPTWLVISIFDSEGRFVGSIPEFDHPEIEHKKIEQLSTTHQTNLMANESIGTSVCLSTGPVSAALGTRLTFFLEKPGTYTVQAVCAKLMFEVPPMTNPKWDKSVAQAVKRKWKMLAGEACRSAPVTMVVERETERSQPSKPRTLDQESPTACRLEHVGTTESGETIVLLRHTNTGTTDLFLQEPVMRKIGDGLSPVRMWLRKSADHNLLLDLSYARAHWQITYPHTIVRLPPGAFVARRHKVPKTWNHLDRTLQAVFSEDLFTTKAYAEYERDGDRVARGISQEDYKLLLKDRPCYLVKSNLLELPAVHPARN